MKILLRFKLAWCAFWLTPIDVQFKPFHYYCKLTPKAGECDNDRYWVKNPCKKEARIALAETRVKISVEEEDFYHVCNDCAKIFDGAKNKWDKELIEIIDD